MRTAAMTMAAVLVMIGVALTLHEQHEQEQQQYEHVERIDAPEEPNMAHIVEETIVVNCPGCCGVPVECKCTQADWDDFWDDCWAFGNNNPECAEGFACEYAVSLTISRVDDQGNCAPDTASGFIESGQLRCNWFGDVDGQNGTSYSVDINVLDGKWIATVGDLTFHGASSGEGSKSSGDDPTGTFTPDTSCDPSENTLEFEMLVEDIVS